ncbi:response regulator transcription factor [Streptomyces sp. HD1123-B1]|uniref:response regulator transcription factor n=1 Tax=Streptomyces huangiella TaxID=3228804 RepID=UPI003D7CD68E
MGDPAPDDAHRPITVLLAEDMPLIRQALVALLARERDIDVVAELDHGDQIVPTAERLRPDIALLDVDLPGLDGISAADALHTCLPRCRTIILTGFAGPAHLRRALSAHVYGFIRKDAPVAHLAQDIRQVASGKRVIDPELAVAAAGMGDNPLTPRERDVLRLAAEGAAPADIGVQLYISVGTVRNHLASVVAKTRARSRVDAVRIAREAGWL